LAQIRASLANGRFDAEDAGVTAQCLREVFVRRAADKFTHVSVGELGGTPTNDQPYRHQDSSTSETWSALSRYQEGFIDVVMLNVTIRVQVAAAEGLSYRFGNSVADAIRMAYSFVLADLRQDRRWLGGRACTLYTDSGTLLRSLCPSHEDALNRR
jgi:hypothetical protein